MGEESPRTVSSLPEAGRRRGQRADTAACANGSRGCAGAQSFKCWVADCGLLSPQRTAGAQQERGLVTGVVERSLSRRSATSYSEVCARTAVPWPNLARAYVPLGGGLQPSCLRLRCRSMCAPLSSAAQPPLLTLPRGIRRRIAMTLKTTAPHWKTASSPWANMLGPQWGV